MFSVVPLALYLLYMYIFFWCVFLFIVCVCPLRQLSQLSNVVALFCLYHHSFSAAMHRASAERKSSASSSSSLLFSILFFNLFVWEHYSILLFGFGCAQTPHTQCSRRVQSAIPSIYRGFAEARNMSMSMSAA